MEKKTEQELRQEIIDEYDFDEDDSRIDKVLEVKKDKYTAIQQKKKERDLREKMEKGKDFYKSQLDPKGKKEAKKATSSSDYSLKDIRALNKVDDDDLDKVITYAEKFHDGSPSKALEDGDLQAILKNRAEERKTAEATETGTGRKGSTKVSGANALEKAKATGRIPDSDAELDALLEERYKS